MPASRIRIPIANRQKVLPVDQALLRRAVRLVVEGEGVKSAEIGLALVTDEEIAALNWQYLRHQGPTDVITFPLSEPDAVPLEGEIVLSAETARREAARRGLEPLRELCLYVIHGVLHLCGYDDRTQARRRLMRVRERLYLSRLLDSRRNKDQ